MSPETVPSLGGRPDDHVTDEEIIRAWLIDEASDILEIAKSEDDLCLATTALTRIARLAGFI